MVTGVISWMAKRPRRDIQLTSIQRRAIQLTYSMVQSPSLEANWFAASQEIPRISRNPQGSLPHSQASATCLYPGPAQSSPDTRQRE